MANKSSRASQCSRGFTLIELLVAISILAVVAVMSWRGLDSIVRARLALNEELAQTRNMQISFAQLQSDCAQLAAPAVTGNLSSIHIAKNRLVLIRTRYADQQAGRMHVVSYRLTIGILSRKESAGTRDLNAIAAFWQAALDDVDASISVPLQSGISTMQLQLWNAETPGWRDTNAATTRPADSGGVIPSSLGGLEVSLFPTVRETPIVKVMLLGAAS